jgi:hypothetical protein
MQKMSRSADVIDGRFTIEQLAGSGGMGQVYRARDHVSGELVALKVMHDAEKIELGRFAREAQVLATLSHPGVVRYIDSGTTPQGEPYLVMEWLSGETLAMRLRRQQLTLAEVLALGRNVASALSAIHRRGVVHRDIKPSNLFLRGSAIDKVTLIDFGMARRPLADPKLTATGTMLGTPGYIAPEQVYNVPNLDGRADIFSLGCVLYRCLSGRAPFRGPDALRLLLNAMTDELPRLRELQPSIPHELDELVARMLSRAPDDRPANADVVAAELLAIEESQPSPLPLRLAPLSVLSEITATERRLMCLVLARLMGYPTSPLSTAGRTAQGHRFRKVVTRHRGKLEVLADGSLLVMFSNGDAATDLASRAARCALSLRRLLGDSSVVVVCGREVPGPTMSEAELLYGAVDLLETTAKSATVRVDELTSALLKNRFDTGRTGHHLRGELRERGRMRLLPGEPLTYVGREQELGQLETIFDQCVEDRVASLVLVTGEEGVGKSRFAHEFLRRLEERGQAVELWIGDADALSADSPFGLLVQVLRRVLDLIDGESIEARRNKVRAWAERGPGGEATRMAELLGELFGGRDDQTEPSAAPHGEQIGQAFLSRLRAECAAQPVLIVLEDLHWGDLATIKLIDAALGALSDQPLMVLALARTKVHETFPQLWADRSVQEIRLHRLSRRASEQLVRHVLGDAVEEETLTALVERSQRHASYLEEFLRAVAEDKGMSTPPAVLAMVQASIEKLDPAARRVLRAASIFGETFWRGGVEALIGGEDTATWLAELVEQGVIVEQDVGRFPAEREFRFRNALVREVAYEMLTKDDRVAGHWLAGQWLEQIGETDATRIEEHFERCGNGGKPHSRP